MQMSDSINEKRQLQKGDGLFCFGDAPVFVLHAENSLQFFIVQERILNIYPTGHRMSSNVLSTSIFSWT